MKNHNKIIRLCILFCLLQCMPLLAEEITKEQSKSIFDLAASGGLVMIPLLAFSIIALTLGLERAFAIRRNNIVPLDYVIDLKRYLGDDKYNLKKASDYCEKSQSPVGRVLKAGLNRMRIERRLSEIEKAMADLGYREIAKLKRSLRGLKVIAGVSPLLGLLGTVFGMINSFQRIEANSASLNRTSELAGGIYEAMVTTATGLVIAIPTLLIFHYLNTKVDSHAHDIEVCADEILNLYLEKDCSSQSGDANRIEFKGL